MVQTKITFYMQQHLLL